MIGTLNRVVYKAFGLRISSEFQLPELAQMSEQDIQVDVKVRRIDLTTDWFDVAKPHEKFTVSENVFMFHIPDTAIFRIQNGVNIDVSVMNDPDEAKIRLYVLGTCMGVLLMQRKILPLHGSAIEIDGKAYAFVGDSGAGKSTLASAFLSKGYRLISDDVIAVTLTEDHIPMVMPAYPQQKLWQESLTEFGVETSNLQSIFNRETKYLVPVPTKFANEPMPLVGIIELNKTASEGVQIQPIEGLERLRTLFNHTFRSSLLERLQLLDWHFMTTVLISKHIDFHQLRRPSSGFTALEMVSLVLQTIQEGERS